MKKTRKNGTFFVSQKSMISKILLVILIVGVLFIAGCGPKCPECPGTGAWSSCNDDAVKTRVNYRCSEAIEFQCEEYTEEKQCATEIRAAGRTGLSEILITPTIEKNVKGTITIELSKAPEEAKAVVFMFKKGKINMEDGMGKNAHMDSEGSDGWSVIYDTTEFENGLYEVAAVVGEGFDDNQPPMDAVSAQIVIDN